jgi:hypothetical protein
LSEENDIDIETLRKPRSTRFREMLSEFIGRLSHRGWKKIEAQVRDCTLVPPSTYPSRYDGWNRIGGYAVSFTYVVNGKAYPGMLNSPVEVQAHDRFLIRYNPRHPEENNSLGSENSWVTLYTTLASAVLVLLMLFLLFKYLLFRT